MLRPANVKGLDIDGSEQDWTVYQFIITEGSTYPWFTDVYCRKTGCNFWPVRQGIDTDNVRMIEHVGTRQKGCSTGQEGKVTFDPIGSNTHFMAIEGVMHCDFLGSCAIDQPMVFVLLLDSEGGVGFSVHCYQLLDLSSVFPNEITTWRPNRHHEFNF